jgi:peroxiredoxin
MLRILARQLHTGQKIGAVKVATVGAQGADMNLEVDAPSIFAGKRVVIVSIPGAFTPTCTGSHIPSFVEAYGKFQEKGVDVVGLTVNDAFVTSKFCQDLNVPFTFIADGSGLLTRSLDAGVDLTDKGLGFRGRRFTALVDNGEITVVNDEEGTGYSDLSKVEKIFEQL